MNPADIVLVNLLDSYGVAKIRPAVILALLPGAYQSFLLCGISSQLQNLQSSWDEVIQRGDPDFVSSGLHRDSAIRLSYLRAANPAEIIHKIGLIDAARLDRLRLRLANYLRP